VRRSAFEEFPLDPGMSAYYEDNEWSLRVQRARPGSFRRCREALCIHHKDWSDVGLDFSGRSWRAERVAAHAHFQRRHGSLLGVDLFKLVPELMRPDGTRDVAAARLLVELTGAHGSDWMLAEWINGGLAPLLGSERWDLQAQLEVARAERARLDTDLDEHRVALQAMRGELDEAVVERDDALERLHRIYASRLWKLGGIYDRTRLRWRRLRAPIGRG
jgi:hypothetical protein